MYDSEIVIFSTNKYKNSANDNFDPLKDEKLRDLLRAWYSLPNPHSHIMIPSKRNYTMTAGNRNHIKDWAFDTDVEPLCSPILISNAPCSKDMQHLTKMLIMKPKCVYMLQLIISRWCHNKPCTKNWLGKQLEYSMESIVEWTMDLRDYNAVTIVRDKQTNTSYVTPTRLILYRALEIISHMVNFSQHLLTNQLNAIALEQIATTPESSWKNLNEPVPNYYHDELKENNNEDDPK